MAELQGCSSAAGDGRAGATNGQTKDQQSQTGLVQYLHTNDEHGGSDDSKLSLAYQRVDKHVVHVVCLSTSSG